MHFRTCLLALLLGAAATSGPARAQAPTTGLDPARIAVRQDSMVVLFQGRPVGWQRSALERTSDGFRYTEETALGTFLTQQTELRLGPRGELVTVNQTGTLQGQPTRIDADYRGGRVKGTATGPGPSGMRTVTFDTAYAAGTLDDNAVQALLPAFAWRPGAAFVVPVFSSSAGAIRPWTFTVTGEEAIVVPAGEFDAWRVQVAGGDQPAYFLVSKAAPHRVLKIAGGPDGPEFVLAR